MFPEREGADPALTSVEDLMRIMARVGELEILDGIISLNRDDAIGGLRPASIPRRQYRRIAERGEGFYHPDEMENLIRELNCE